MKVALQRLTTGFKLNSAADNPANFAICTKMESKLSSYSVAKQNTQIGSNLLTTTEGTLELIENHLQRIRDLTEQAANGTYGSDSRKAMQIEVQSRMDEINRLCESSEFNGIKLFNGSRTNGINLQVGINSDSSSVINLSADLFAQTDTKTLLKVDNANSIYQTEDSARNFLKNIDTAISEISLRKTKIGAYQNRLSSVIDFIDIQTQSLTESISTLKDADIAEESSNFINAQIRQQAAAALLMQANNSKGLALQLIQSATGR